MGRTLPLLHESTPLKWDGTCACGETHVYRIQTDKGFTDSFGGKQIRTLVDLGLIAFSEDSYDLEDGHGRGVGPLVRWYRPATP